MTFALTGLYALPLTIMMMIFWISVTKTRAKSGISIGDAGNVDLHERIRRHGNFMEWVPITLTLMALAEANGADAYWIHAAGVLCLIGRIVHPFGLKAENASHSLRIVGNVGNILAVLTIFVALLRLQLAA